MEIKVLDRMITGGDKHIRFAGEGLMDLSNS